MATSLAIRDLQASQHQVIDQLKALQEAVSSYLSLQHSVAGLSGA